MEVLLHRCKQIVTRPSKTLTGTQVGAAPAAQEGDREREGGRKRTCAQVGSLDMVFINSKRMNESEKQTVQKCGLIENSLCDIMTTAPLGESGGMV